MSRAVQKLVSAVYGSGRVTERSLTAILSDNNAHWRCKWRVSGDGDGQKKQQSLEYSRCLFLASLNHFVRSFRSRFNVLARGIAETAGKIGAGEWDSRLHVCIGAATYLTCLMQSRLLLLSAADWRLFARPVSVVDCRRLPLP